MTIWNAAKRYGMKKPDRSLDGLKNIIFTITPLTIRRLVTRLGDFYKHRSRKSEALLLEISHTNSLERLKSLGWAPDACIDIGAHEGAWAKLFLSTFPEARILMIEARESKAKHLAEQVRYSPSGSDYAITLLGECHGSTLEFFEMGTGSSIFEEKSHFPRQKVIRQCASLDAHLESFPSFAAADFIKLDTQGSELSILRGAKTVLSKAKAVMIETSLVPINEGAPLFAEIIEFMDAHRFKLFDIADHIRRKDGILWQIDLLFIRPEALPPISPTLCPGNWY